MSSKLVNVSQIGVEDYYLQLARNPCNWEMRLQLAEHYDRIGEPKLAGGQRWQVFHHKAPLLRGYPMHKQECHWSCYKARYPADSDSVCSTLYKLLRQQLHTEELSVWSKVYSSLLEADEALAEALWQLGK